MKTLEINKEDLESNLNSIKVQIRDLDFDLINMYIGFMRDHTPINQQFSMRYRREIEDQINENIGDQ